MPFHPPLQVRLLRLLPLKKELWRTMKRFAKSYVTWSSANASWTKILYVPPWSIFPRLSPTRCGFSYSMKRTLPSAKSSISRTPSPTATSSRVSTILSKARQPDVGQTSAMLTAYFRCHLSLTPQRLILIPALCVRDNWLGHSYNSKKMLLRQPALPRRLSRRTSPVWVRRIRTRRNVGGVRMNPRAPLR